jgi:hypothetical protein
MPSIKISSKIKTNSVLVAKTLNSKVKLLLEIDLNICYNIVIIYSKCLTIGLRYIIIGSQVIISLNLFKNNVILLFV